MAEVKRYVNRAADSGGDGTTNGLTGVNCAYQTLNLWEAAEQTDLVADGDTHVVECTGTVSTQDTALCSLDGWITGPSNDITVDGLDAYTGYKMESSALVGRLDILED